MAVFTYFFNKLYGYPLFICELILFFSSAATSELSGPILEDCRWIDETPTNKPTKTTALIAQTTPGPLLSRQNVYRDVSTTAKSSE